MEHVIYPVINMAATGERIRSRRKAANLSVNEIQQYLGLEHPQAIYKWQRGETLPSIDNLLALSRVLHVHMEDLLVWNDREVSVFLRQMILRIRS